MNRLSLRRWAGVLYVLAVMVLALSAGEPGKLWWWLGALPIVAWISSPILGGLWLVRLLANSMAAASYLALLAIIAIAGYALQWHTMFIGPSDAQNALILVFVPFWQWAAVALILGLCMAVARVFARADRKD